MMNFLRLLVFSSLICASCTNPPLYTTTLAFPEEGTNIKTLQSQLEKRFNRSPYKIIDFSITGNKLNINSYLPNENEETLEDYNLLFEQVNFRVINSQSTKKIERKSLLDEIDGFDPYYSWPYGDLPADVLGTADDLSRAESIKERIESEYDDIKVHWSKYISVLDDVYYLHATTKNNLYEITDEHILGVRAHNHSNHANELTISLNPKGAKIFFNLTSRAASKNREAVLMLLNGKVISNPRVNEPINQGRVIFSGNLTDKENIKLEKILFLGRLDTELTILSQNKIIEQE